MLELKVTVPIFDEPAPLVVAKTVKLWRDDAAPEERRLVYGIVYEPDERDSHGDYMDADTIERAAHGFMQSRMVGLQHEREAPATVVESYIAPTDMVVAGQAVKKGSWMMVMRVEDQELWGRIKMGEFGGLSLGGFGERIEDVQT
jgi:hypothetical protein